MFFNNNRNDGRLHLINEKSRKKKILKKAKNDAEKFLKKRWNKRVPQVNFSELNSNPLTYKAHYFQDKNEANLNCQIILNQLKTNILSQLLNPIKLQPKTTNSRQILLNPFCSSYLKNYFFYFFLAETHLNMLKIFLKQKKFCPAVLLLQNVKQV